MKKLFYITLIISLLISTVQAQQLPLSSLYNVNKFQINSAYAGFNNCVEGYLSHRSQWVGIDGAPTTQYLSLHSGIAKNMGLGANLVYDKTDIISKFSGALSYAYRVKLGQEHNLRFGISAGIYQVGINPSNAIIADENDDIIVFGSQSSMAFNNEVSLFYNYKKFQFGLSIPQAFETNASFDLASTDGGFGLKRHIISTVGYDVDLTKKLSFQPSVLYKSQNGNQTQLDINGQITYNKLISVGVGYRTDGGLLARLGLTIQELFTVAYAYEFANGDVGSFSSGSHEIMLGIKFCKDKDKKIVDVTPIVEPAVIIEEKVVEEVKEEPIKEVVVIEEEEPIVIEKTVEEKTTQLELANKIISETKAKFLKNSTTFSKSYLNNLDKVIKIMEENPSIQIEIIGHSCDLGSSEVRGNIAKERAVAVQKYFIKKGISPFRLKTKGMSNSQPLVPNTSEANRQKNRRVEFILMK